MRLKIIFIILFISLLAFICLTSPALALTSVSDTVKDWGGRIFGGTPQEPANVIAMLIKGALTFLGIIFLGVIIYGGFLYMTASGEETKLNKAKNTIITAVIGMIIVMSSYAIATFVISKITNTSVNTSPGQGTGGAGGRGPGSGGYSR